MSQMSILAPLVGLEVHQIWVWDATLRLAFDQDIPGTHIDVADFEFTEASGAVHHISMERDPASAGVCLAILHHRVTEASAAAWVLRLTFDSEAVIVCRPHPQYEAWYGSIPGDPALYCPPGGDPDFPG
jgi:hypothetical protein